MSPMPMTTGVLRTKIEDMEIGDYIQIYSMGTGVAYGIGSGSKTELPVVGVANGSTAHNYFWYMVKVAKGLLISDRVWFHTYAWDALNIGKLIQGSPVKLGVNDVILRSPTGGVAYADANGNMSLTDKGFGAFPTNNEWDRYIVNFPADKIQSGKTLDDVFHFLRDTGNPYTWCQDTPVNGLRNYDNTTTTGINTNRTYRATSSSMNIVHGIVSSASNTTIGFRPVSAYQEV